MIDLQLDGAGVGFAFGEAGLEFFGAHAESAVVGEAINEVVAGALAGTVGAGGGDGVLFDDFVGGLASDPALHGGHHDGRAEEEGQIMAIFPLDHGGVGVHLIEDGDESLEQSVGGKKGIGQHDAAHDGAGDVALIPLIPGEARGHREIAAEDGFESVDPFAAAAVHFVRHRGRADLAFGEAFAGELVSGHESERFRKAGRG